MSDLSAFHRIDAPEMRPALEIINLATRLPAYGGIVARRAQLEADENGQEMAAMGVIDDGTGVQQVDPSTVSLAASPELAYWLDVQQVEA